MLDLTIPGKEYFNNETQEFISSEGKTVRLEHSLVSISKWEAKWGVPFLKEDDKTPEQLLDYIKLMCVTQNVPDEVFDNLSQENVNDIVEYINNPMTATTITNNKKARSREIITSELIYYWMIALNIPFECQKWHINRLLTLINVCNVKNDPKNTMSKREILRDNAAINAARKAKLNTKG